MLKTIKSWILGKRNQEINQLISPRPSTSLNSYSAPTPKKTYRKTTQSTQELSNSVPPSVNQKSNQQKQVKKIVDQLTKIDSLGHHTNVQQKQKIEILIRKLYREDLGEEAAQIVELRLWSLEESPEASQILKMEPKTRRILISMKLERWIRTLLRGKCDNLQMFQARYQEVMLYLQQNKVETVIMEEAWNLSVHLIQDQ
uniref:C protein n=1 Tax=Human respirovirus 3 TaxID=11216 RepID=A0A2S1GIN2_9MONO|nr:C protein [Human respirovirus 3]